MRLHRLIAECESGVLLKQLAHLETHVLSVAQRELSGLRELCLAFFHCAAPFSLKTHPAERSLPSHARFRRSYHYL